MAGGDHRYLHVLGVDGAVGAATPAGPDGVTVEVAGGGQLTVEFDPAGPGATLTLNGKTHALGATVATLPE